MPRRNPVGAVPQEAKAAGADRPTTVLRIPIAERPDWKSTAEEYGFKFHTIYGEKYWDESAYYQFTLDQIENDLEEPTRIVNELCLAAVEHVIKSDNLLRQFRIPEQQWGFIRRSWDNGDPSLYSRLDFSYDGKSPAKLLENNADTPTSVYETGFWQWLWLEQSVDSNRLPRRSDQFNSLQEKLVNRFKDLAFLTPERVLHFSCCKDTEEDRGTVQYLEDCARAAGISTRFVYIEDIGESESGSFTDLDDEVITWLFKLYPWEFMFEDRYGAKLNSAVRYIEPPWKCILSNKALLPLLWSMFPEHPNLLPAFFEDDIDKIDKQDEFVRKPLYSREGANVSFLAKGRVELQSDGPYGDEGFIYQKSAPLPRFGNDYTLIGSWLVGDEPAGISIREDKSLITQDTSRFIPHVIL